MSDPVHLDLGAVAGVRNTGTGEVDMPFANLQLTEVPFPESEVHLMPWWVGRGVAFCCFCSWAVRSLLSTTAQSI